MNNFLRPPFFMFLPALVAAALAGFFVAPFAWAVTQGTLGATSTMTINIDIEVGREVRVFNLDDLDLGTFDFSTSQIQNNETFCVYDNGAAFSQTYAITFDSSVSPGSFNLANGGNTIAYSVEYDDSQSGTNFRTASPGAPIVGNVNGADGSTSCASVGGDNGNVRVTVQKTDAQGSPSGVYTDTLTVLVEPE